MLTLLIMGLLALINFLETGASTGDLIFEVASGSAMSSAIADATAQNDSVKFSHVGIVLVDNNSDCAVNTQVSCCKPSCCGAQISVLEANAKGVVITPLDSFINNAPNGFIVKRLDIDFPVEKCIERAKTYLGRGYDWWYLPDNDEIYCSELVEKSYLMEDGMPIFETLPMNFRDRNGNMPQFWTELFERLGRSIPEGEPGTNPTQLSQDPRLKTIAVYK